VFATGFASGTVLDGHDDDAVNDGFRFFRGADGLFVVDFADRVTTVSNQNDDFASLPAIE